MCVYFDKIVWCFDIFLFERFIWMGIDKVMVILMLVNIWECLIGVIFIEFIEDCGWSIFVIIRLRILYLYILRFR